MTGLESQVKSMHYNLTNTLNFQIHRWHELTDSQSDILRIVREIAYKPSSPPRSSPTTPAPSSMPSQSVDSALQPIQAKLSELSSSFETFKDQVHREWNVLREQIIAVLTHPSSEYTFLFDDAKKGESEPERVVMARSRGITINELTGEFIPLSTDASRFPPPPVSKKVAPLPKTPTAAPPVIERLALGKAGEAQRFHDERKRQVDEDHELALRIQEEEKAEYEREMAAKEKESGVGTETKREDVQGTQTLPPNKKPRIVRVTVTPQSKKVPETYYTIFRVDGTKASTLMSGIDKLHPDEWAQMIEVLPKSGRHVLALKAHLNLKWFAHQKQRSLQGEPKGVSTPTPGLPIEPGTVTELPELGMHYRNHLGRPLFVKASDLKKFKNEDLVVFLDIMKKVPSSLKFHDALKGEMQRRINIVKMMEKKKGAGVSGKVE